jgi:hypothetical protein
VALTDIDFCTDGMYHKILSEWRTASRNYRVKTTSEINNKQLINVTFSQFYHKLRTNFSKNSIRYEVLKPRLFQILFLPETCNRHCNCSKLLISHSVIFISTQILASWHTPLGRHTGK